MANTLRIKRRVSGATGAPAALKSAELAYNMVDDTVYAGFGDDGSGNATSIKPVGGEGTFAKLASPTFTGTPAAPTPSTADSSTKIATTAYVQAQGYITGNQSISISGDATGSGTTSIALTLANSGVSAGTYNDSATAVRPFTVDAKGRVTSIGTAVTITPAWSSVTSTPTTLAGYGITDAVSSSLLGANSGVATLDSAGKVPSSQLPAYVDDVLEYANLAAFPATGSSGIIYVAIDTGVVYRWSGSTYIVISSAGTADEAAKLTTPRSITATGDASWTVNFDGSANVSAALTLASSGVAAGTYNDSATAVRPFTVDAKGRVTSIGTAVTIAPAFSSVTGKPTTLSGYGITDGLSTDSTIDGGTF